MKTTDSMTEEEMYMLRCIQLAENGTNNVSPNPKVGAVIVCDGKIIGEGYHVCSGCAHAEVNAINSVKSSSLLCRSTLYVTLEPCSHHGKTPPCADLIIRKEIPKVVIGCKDPSSKVSGRGIKKLKEAGVEVTVGILEEKCHELIKRFTTLNLYKRPYITLKWAQSSDGFIDMKRHEGKPVALSNPLTTMLVHKKRAETDAIMVGTHTALLDNPSLTVRSWRGNNPIRIVLDKDLSLPSSLSLFNGQAKTWVFTSKEKKSQYNVEYIKLNYQGDILTQIMRYLYEKEIQSLLVEGGSILLQSFIDKGIWDECFIEKATLKLVDGVKAPRINENTECVIEEIWNAQISHLTRE